MTKDNEKIIRSSPTIIDEYVGNQLRIRRLSLGLSQEKLSDSVGITFQQIQKYERGSNRVSAGRLYEFSRLLDVPITYFYDGLEELDLTPLEITAGQPIEKQEHMFKSANIEILRNINNILDKDVKKAVCELIKTLKTKDED